ncbi:MAG: hypothetical protein HY532_04485 [Chloroflexi bacterium]|nr:hypothetical protein [Chloroflexota bacterium]
MTLSTEALTFKYHSSDAIRERVDRAFALVEAGIRAFALEHALELRPWYHDIPVWILSFQHEGIARDIHVGALYLEDSEEVGLAVAVYAYEDGFAEGRRKAMHKAIPIGKLSARDLEERHEGMSDLLEKAYQRAKGIKEKDLA